MSKLHQSISSPILQVAFSSFTDIGMFMALAVAVHNIPEVTAIIYTKHYSVGIAAIYPYSLRMKEFSFTLQLGDCMKLNQSLGV